MQNLRTLLLQFYRPLFLWNLIFSLVGLRHIFAFGIGQLGATFFVKLVGYASTIGFQYYYSANTFYYYRNAGYAVRRLYSYTFLFDFFIYLLLVSVLTLLMALLHA